MSAPRPSHRLPLILSGLAALLTLPVSVLGVTDTTATYGRLTPRHMLPGALSQDVISLAVALIVLILTVRLWRGGGPSWLFWLGLVGYLLYAYALYVIDRLYTPLFLIYVAILSLSLWAVIAFFAAHPVEITPLAPPRRSVAALFGLLVVLFLGLWLSIIWPAMLAHAPPEGHSIFVIDLTVVLPLLGLASWLLFTARPMGDLIAIPLLLKAGTLGLSVFLGALFAPLFGQSVVMADLAVYGFLAVAPLAFVPWYARQLLVRPAAP